MFLNNRYHDPTTGTFISVDPLVTTTGQPYIYGAANPITLSDPSGLCPYTGCWEAFDAYLRGLREAAAHVQDDSEVSPGESLPWFRVQRHAEKQAAWSLDFNNPIGIGGTPVRSRIDPRPEIEPYRQAEDCAGPFCAAWEHRRGLLQISGALVGGGCVFVTGGTGSVACVAAGTAIATASVAQSAADNLGGDEQCVGTFAADVGLNFVSVAAPAFVTSRIVDTFGRGFANSAVAYETSIGGVANSIASEC